jgi:hypothetical protein
MQNGSMMRTERHVGPDVWEFRWREPGPDGRRKHRRMVVGTTNEFDDEVAARQAIAGLHLRMNAWNERVKMRQITLSELVDHYRHRELKPDILWKTHSTKVTYDGYLNKWIVPRWGSYTLNRISAGEVELWLRSLALAKSSCAKIRNIMSVLFNHGIRHEICEHNPIRLVRATSQFTVYEFDQQSAAQIDIEVKEDRQGTLWIGTHSAGLERFDPATGRFTAIYKRDANDPTSLSNDRVNSVHFDHSGTMWVGTQEGLDKFDPRTGKFKTYYEQDGLPGNAVSASWRTSAAGCG